MSMFVFLGKRIALSIFALFGLSLLIFLIARVLPGDPVRMAVGPRAPEWVAENIREQMHLDKPVLVQYYYWVRGALQGDFGYSLYSRRAVSTDLKNFLPATGELAIFTSLIIAGIGIPLGVLAGRYSNSWIDNLVRIFCYISASTPSFVFATLFLLLFSYVLHWFPIVGRISLGVPRPPVVTGMITLDGLISGNFTAFWNTLWHMVLPAVSLALPGMAQVARITRSSIQDNLGKDYIAFERGFGIPDRLIMSKFLLKPSLIPPVSILGLEMAVTIGIAFLVELIFNWPGFSRYGINAMLQKDLNAMSAVVMVIGVIFVIANIFVDVAIAFLDPKIRLGAGRRA